MEDSTIQRTVFALLIFLSFLFSNIVITLVLLASAHRKFKILGAKVVKTFPPLAVLQVNNRDFFIQAFLGLEIFTECKSSGFFGIFKNPLTKKFDIFYDDLSWGEKARSALHFIEDLPQHPFSKRLGSLVLDGNKLKLKLWYTKYDKGNPEEDLPNALKFLEEIAPQFDHLPRSLMGNSKERVRVWLCFKIPLGFLITLLFLSFFLVAGGFGGKVICDDQVPTLGLKLALPVILFYLVLAFITCGKSLLKHPKHLSLLLVLLAFSATFFAFLGVDLLNEFLDKSPPKIITTKVTRLKVSSSNNRKSYRVAVENIPCSFKVREEFFRKAREGDSVKLIIRSGAFGLKWLEKTL